MTVFGIVFTLALRAQGIKGDLLIGIIATTVFATTVNWATDYTAFERGARLDLTLRPDS